MMSRRRCLVDGTCDVVLPVCFLLGWLVNGRVVFFASDAMQRHRWPLRTLELTTEPAHHHSRPPAAPDPALDPSLCTVWTRLDNIPTASCHRSVAKPPNRPTLLR